MDHHYIVAPPTAGHPAPAPMFTRRAFVRRAAALGASLALDRRRGIARSALAPGRARGIAAPALSIALVGGGDDARHGALLGVDEAERAARLFGGSIAFAHHDAPVAGSAARALVAEAARRRVAALIVADPAAWDTLSDAAGRARLLTVNVASRTAARRGACAPGSYHMIASDGVRQAALAQWMAAADAAGAPHDGARAAGDQPAANVAPHAAAGEPAGPTVAPRAGAATTDVLEWHPSLERFGAMELNARYAQRFGAPMTAEAWLAWAAVKVLWETTLRTRSGDPLALATALAADGTQFDGHKGVPLSFQRATHQLRQPLYVVQRAADGGERVVGELPRAGAAPARDRLDAITPVGDSTLIVCR